MCNTTESTAGALWCSMQHGCGRMPCTCSANYVDWQLTDSPTAEALTWQNSRAICDTHAKQSFQTNSRARSKAYLPSWHVHRYVGSLLHTDSTTVKSCVQLQSDDHMLTVPYKSVAAVVSWVAKVGSDCWKTRALAAKAAAMDPARSEAPTAVVML